MTRRRQSAPTVVDVAKAAGVALGTVSRVLNGNATVTPEIEEKVRAAIAKTGFRPNVMAQSMRRRFTKTIGVVVHDIAAQPFASLVKAVQETFNAAGYFVLLSSSGTEEAGEIRTFAALAEWRVDGLITMLGNEQAAGVRAALTALGRPVVLIERDMPDLFDRVLIDHRVGIAAATRALLEVGHRRIALITGPQSNTSGRARADGYRDAFAERKLKIDPSLVRIGGFSASFGSEQVSIMLTGREPPTAIIAGGAEMLPGVITAVRQAGLRIPKDVTLVAAGDSPLAELSTPPISALQWDMAEVGRIAARLLLSRIDGSVTAQARRVILPATFVPRGLARLDKGQ